MLCFEAKALVLLEPAGALVARQEISAIKLHSRLRREHFHHAATHWLFDASRQPQFARLAADDVAMVIPLRLVRLLFQLADPLADRVWRGEIKRRSFHVG